MFAYTKNSKSIRSLTSMLEFDTYVAMEMVIPYRNFIDLSLELRDDLWEEKALTGEYIYNPNLPMPVVAINYSTMSFYRRRGLFGYEPVDLVEHAMSNDGRVDDLYVRTAAGVSSVANCWGVGASLKPYDSISTVWTTLEVFAWELQCMTEGQGCTVYRDFKAPSNYRYCYDGFRRAYLANVTKVWDGRNPMPDLMREKASDEEQIRHLFNYHSSKLIHSELNSLQAVLEFFSMKAEDCELHIRMDACGVAIEMGGDKKYLPWLREKIARDDGNGDILKIHEDLE